MIQDAFVRQRARQLYWQGYLSWKTMSAGYNNFSMLHLFSR